MNHLPAHLSDPHAGDLAFASDGGEMGAVLRGLDWRASPLGPLAGWPQPLRTAVGIMLGSSQPMYVAWGPQLCLLYNDAYRQILGARALHPERILGQPFRAVWADIWETIEPMLAAARRGEPFQVEDHPFVLMRNGYPEQMYASLSLSAVRDERGAIAGVFCACTETTAKVASQAERDAALAELAASKEKLEIAADAAQLGMFEFGMQTGEVVWSPRTREHYGLPPDAMPTVYTLNEALHPKDRERVGTRFRALLAPPGAALEGVYADEFRTIGRLDGRERWISVRGRMIRDAAGRALRLIGTTLDITERRRVEERLRLLDEIGEATRIAAEPAAIMEEATRLLGEHLGVTRVAYADVEPDNDRFTIRHDWREAGAASSAGVYSLDLFGSRATSNLRVGRTLLIDDVDSELSAGDGFEMFNRIGIKAIICCPLVKQGRLVAMMAVHQRHPRAWTEGEVALVEAVVERCWAHIERVRSTEALREADRRKSEFLATLAHELRNPLAPIRNGLELLRLAANKPETQATVRAMMERQVGHMVHLINDLLDIARVSSGKLVLKTEPVTLEAVVAGAVETSLPLVEAAGHALSVRLPETPVPLEVDRIRISQVLSNLLSNAAKYTPRGGRIAVEARVEDGQAVIAVSDTGIGIAAESLPAVFDMFTQVARSIDRSRGGLGIGLALVRHLVQLHGGSVTAASPGPGLGSSFTVRLPLGTAPAVASDAAAAPMPAVPIRSLRVLVADDNVDAAQSLRALLELGGHQVRVAHDGQGAVELAGAMQPELVFLDIGMPRMDGYQAARAIRGLPELAEVPLVAVTGWGAEDDRRRSREAGFDAHLLKPAMPEQVAAILARTAAHPGAHV
ncbi:ATP-binding protein [Massilia sp.]|uniref:ATP-binding protein n=1 Tax=Massilia sp. TaxID=1882437 RepID=UPI0028AB176B|nr:ATP-binding protein [Massilia sp.]